MASRDPRIDAYIAKAAPFARPVLRHVGQLVHQGCPEVQETIKWSMPHFDYHGIMLGMAAFNEHCSIGFWKDRKSTRLNSSHVSISYAVFCLNKKTKPAKRTSI